MQRKARRLRCLALVLIVAVTISILPAGLLAPAAAAAVTTADGEPVGDFVRGDVTGDGVVDGRDALQIMRILEGYEPATAETTARGDVYPVPGTDGRLMGDGVLTAEDAWKILRGSVGLVSSGEISGDFAGSAPRITDFEPASGQVGTRVTITGENFLEGSSVENVVMFGDVPAPVIFVTGTRLITEAPVGARSGPILVQTPGGMATSGDDFIVTRMAVGQLALAEGLNPQDFTPVNPYGEAITGAGGSFELPVPVGRVSLLGAVPNGGGKNSFLAVMLPEDANGGSGDLHVTAAGAPVQVDAASTARTLVLLHPFFLTPNPATTAGLLQLMDPMPEVATLAQVIADRYPQGAPGLDDPVVKTAWEEAVAALVNALPPAMVYSLGESSGDSQAASDERGLQTFGWPGSPELNPGVSGQVGQSLRSLAWSSDSGPAVRIIGLDKDFLSVERDRDSLAIGLTVTPVTGYNPLDLVVKLYRLDLAAFPQGLNIPFKDLQASAFPRLAEVGALVLPANQWTGKIDIVYTLAETVLKNLSRGDDLPHLPDEDAVYVVRAFSGAVVDPEGNDFGVIDAMLDDRTVANQALAVNLSLLLADIWELVTPSAKQVSQEALKKGVQNLVRELSRMGVNWSELSNDQKFEELWELLVEVAINMATTLPSYGVSTAGRQLAGTGLDALKHGNGLLGTLGKISTTGRIGERLAALVGLMPNPLDLEIAPGPTPLESVLVVVGDPFGPRISSFSPVAGGAGEEVVIQGERFAPSPAANEVIFSSATYGELPAEVIASSPTELTVRVPYGGMGFHKLKVATPAGGPAVSARSFNLYRTPALIRLEPTFGYAPAADFAGSPYLGAEIKLEGRFLIPEDDAGENIKDDVLFGMPGGDDAVQAEVISQSSQYLMVQVPIGAAGTPVAEENGPSGQRLDVQIRTGDYNTSSNPLPFTIVGPPVLSQATPEQLKGGETMTLLGANFSPAPGQTRVRFEYLDQVVYADPEDSVSWRMLQVKVPFSIPDETDVLARVETPAGVSGGFVFQRQAGLVTGGQVFVTTASAAVAADGELSLPEAVQIVTGRLDPYQLPWDDRDEQWTTHYYVAKEQAIDDWGNLLYDGEGNPVYKYIWKEGDTDQEYLTDKGHAGFEYRYFYRVYHAHPDHGGGVSEPEPWNPLWSRQGDSGNPLWDVRDNLDGVDEERGYQPEEGDYANFSDDGSWGAGTADTIRIFSQDVREPLAPGAILALDTGYDTIEASGASVVIGAEIRLSSNGNVIKFPTFSNPGGPGIVITGNGNRVQEAVLKNNAGAGVRIAGGAGNDVISVYAMDNDGAGVEITGSARGNRIVNGNLIRNETGALIDGAGTEGNVVKADIGYWGPGEEAGNRGNGVVIAGGARFNVVNYKDTFGGSFRVDNSGLDGVLITGEGTEGNVVGGSINGNSKNGVHVTGGASWNSIGTSGTSLIRNSGENGIFIDGSSNGNTVANWDIAGSQQAGVKVSGNEHDQPSGTRIQHTTARGQVGIWVSGVNQATLAADGSLLAPSLVVEESQGLGSAGVEDSAGFLLDNGARYVRLDSIRAGDRDTATGLRLAGPETAWNEISNTFYNQLVGSRQGVHITGGTHHNTLSGGSVRYDPRNPATGLAGILVDGGAHDNWLEKVTIANVSSSPGDGLVLDAADNNYIIGGEASYHKGSGVVIRNGSRDSMVRGLVAQHNADHGLVLQGASVEGTVIEEVTLSANGGNGLLVDGATVTRIGGMQEGTRTNSITWNDAAGIRITGGASGVEVHRSEIVGVPDNSGQGNYGILVDGGAQNVLIGSWENWTLADNVIIENGDDGIRIAGASTRGVVVERSLIGMSLDDFEVRPNLGHGVAVLDGAADIQVGSARPGGGNIIAGNQGAGIYAAGSDTRVSIEGNTIGFADLPGPSPNQVGLLLDDGLQRVRVAGNGIAGNSEQGVLIQNSAHHNLLVDNRITNNGSEGIRVVGQASVSNQFNRNSITANQLAGVALAEGGNNEIQAPVIEDFAARGGWAQGYVEPGVPRGSTVDIFADLDDEGQIYVGSGQVTGNRFYIRALIPPGLRLHALVTGPDGNTSAFGPYTPGPDVHLQDSGFVFSSSRDGNPEIYFLPPGEEQPSRLTNAGASDHSPRLSPDRRQVAFVADRAGSEDIWLMHSDGANAAPVTDHPARDYDPAWSPDGLQLAFVSERDGNPEIYVTGAAGPGLQGEVISYDDGQGEFFYPFTPLEQAVALGVRFTADPGTLSQVQFYIAGQPAPFDWAVLDWTGDRAGEVLAQGTTTPAATGWHTVEVGPVQVPADYVVAAYTITGGPRFGVDTTGPGDQRSLVYYQSAGDWFPANNFQPGWDLMFRSTLASQVVIGYDDGQGETAFPLSPSNQAAGLGMRFTARPGATLTEVQFHIADLPGEFGWAVLDWTGEAPGAVLAQGTTVPAAAGWHTVDVGAVTVPADFVVAAFTILGGAIFSLDLSGPADRRSLVEHPDWGWLPFDRLIPQGVQFMIRSILAPPAPHRLTGNDAADRQPAWSPDGRRIAFTSGRAGNIDIWVMDADGANHRPLTDSASLDYRPAWSLDGSQIAFVSERDGNPEIYLMDSDGGNFTRLTSHPGLDIDPAFTQGGRVLFSSDREAGLEIYSMGQDGAGVSRLTTSLGANTQPHAGTLSAAGSASAAGFRAASSENGEGPRVVVESQTARAGATVTVSVDLTGAQDLGQLSFDLGYDRDQLTLLSLEPGEFTTSGLVAINPENQPNAAGQVRFNWVRASGFNGGGRIMTLTFKVAPDAAGGDLALSLSLSGLAATLSADGVAMAEAPATGQDGAILVAPLSSADVDGNGVVDLADLTLVAGAYGTKSSSGLWNEYLDLAPDGVIDLYDLVLVARRLQPR